MGVIYSIMNPKGRLYVGKTYDLRKRINCHKHCAKKDKTNIILHNSIKKYGWESHLLQVIEEVEEDRLNEREMFWIATLKTYCYENKMGMNMTIGGDGQRSTWMHDTERRKKASKRFSGENNPFFGKTLSEEAKAIIGKKASDRNKKQGRTVPQWGVEKGRELTRKAVLAYTIVGNFIKEFKSLNEAALFFGINRKGITAVLRGNQTMANSLIFKYKTSELVEKTIDVSHVKEKIEIKPVIYIDKHTNTITEYTSAKEASKELGIHHHNIQRAAKHYKGRPIRSGHIFVYKDEYEKQLSNQLN